MQPNQAQSWVLPALIGTAVLGGLFLFSRSSSASSASSTPTPPSVPPPVTTGPCKVTQAGLGQWAMTVNMTAMHVPMLAITDPVKAELAIDILPSEIGTKLKALPSYEQIVLVDKNNVFHHFDSKTAPDSHRRDDLYADYCKKVGSTLSGHPADLFMVW